MSTPLTTPVTATAPRPRVLCVDDEPQVLDGLTLHLRRRYEVLRATSGEEGLAVLQHEHDVAAILSDMRMPGMNGATFLCRARQIAPDATRVLLTGQTDLDSAIAAVNDGHIFRFLTKPCPPPVLLTAMEASAAQYRLLTSERVLLEQTLHGSIKALTDVLAITSPRSFGRALRVKKLVAALARELQVADRWQVEVAAMLAPLGNISLPNETVERIYEGDHLTIDDHRMISKVPALTEQLLASIPRLETVRAIVAMSSRLAGAPKGPCADGVVIAGRILRLALDFDTLEAKGHSATVALTLLKERTSIYDETTIAALDRIQGISEPNNDIAAVQLSGLEVGMVLAEDIKLTTGALLAARGYEVTAGFVARVDNFRNLVSKRLISVRVPKAAADPVCP